MMRHVINSSIMIRVVLVDNHRVFRRVLRRRLEGFDLATIVGEAASGKEAVALTTLTSPDLVLMEVELPEMNGLETGNLIKQEYPEITVALYALLEITPVTAGKYGSTDYCLRKDLLFDSLTEVIRNVELKNNRNDSAR